MLTEMLVESGRYAYPKQGGCLVGSTGRSKDD